MRLAPVAGDAIHVLAIFAHVNVIVTFTIGQLVFEVAALVVRSPRKLNLERCTTRAFEFIESVPKKIVAPKIRSKAATKRRYSLPPFAIPKVSSISAPDLKRIIWLFCWTAIVANKIGTKRSCPKGRPKSG